jgi:hypothetical protein
MSLSQSKIAIFPGDRPNRKADANHKGRSMLRFFQASLLAIAVALTATHAASAQTTTPAPTTVKKKLSPGEMAEADKEKTEKTAACRAKAKEQTPKLGLSARRAFVKDCVAKMP